MSFFTNTVVNISVTLRIVRFSSNFSKSNLNKLLETMPKEPTHRAEAQKQRLKIKEKSQKYVPGKVTLQVLGTGAEGAPKALYMFTDQSRYLFNCGEGTQRLAHEHKMKLSKLEHIFITQPAWSNIGGLPGLSLTIQDAGVPQITLHGPEGLDELFIATRRFVVLKDLKVTTADCKSDKKFEDNVMRVQYVPIVRNTASNEKGIQAGVEMVDASTSTRTDHHHHHPRRRARAGSCNRLEYSDDDTDYYAHESKKKRKRRRARSCPASGGGSSRAAAAAAAAPPPPPPPSIPSQIAHVDREQNTVMCYVLHMHARPGALSLEKCVEAGVPAGPLLGQLKAGNDITLPSGAVVRSKDVCHPDDPGPIVIVADCPSPEYLDSLLSNEEFKKFQSTARCDDDLAYFVIHFTPADVMKDSRYQTWVDRFSPSTQHVALNDGNTCMGSAAVYRIQCKLNLLHEGLFPLLGDKGTRTVVTPGNKKASKKPKTDPSARTENCETSQLIEKLSMDSPKTKSDDCIVQAGTFCNIHVRPKRGLDRSDELQLLPSEYVEETMRIEGFADELRHLKEELRSKKAMAALRPPPLYPCVVFLGTGSCIPNKTRNTSGILVHISENSSFLMDCGEGTYGQLVRFYGYERAKQVLANLKAVYISHLHADHHIGLVGLLHGRKKAMQRLGVVAVEPLLLLAPRQILSWLNLYHHRFEKIADDYELLPNGSMILDDNKLNAEQKQVIAEKLGMSNVSTVLVKHCPNAFGVAFVHESGWKITYSGDTMPCERLIHLGIDSDLLIHEATMEDDLAHEAVVKMHSTTTQAIQIGQNMNAKHIILTHFSQRYAKLPRFNDNFAENVGIAFDNMQVRLDEISLVPLLYPALRLMFAEHYEELEHKAVRRQLKAGKRDRFSL